MKVDEQRAADLEETKALLHERCWTASVPWSRSLTVEGGQQASP